MLKVYVETDFFGRFGKLKPLTMAEAYYHVKSYFNGRKLNVFNAEEAQKQFDDNGGVCELSPLPDEDEDDWDDNRTDENTYVEVARIYDDTRAGMVDGMFAKFENQVLPPVVDGFPERYDEE